MNPRERGARIERELVRKLWKHGFAAIRAPASGSKVKHAVYPDVVAIYHGKVYVFEVKTREKLETVYIPKQQVEKLLEFARRAGAKAYIALKIRSLNQWFIVPIEKLENMGTRYRIGLTVLKTAQTLEQFITSVTTVSLQNYMRPAQEGGASVG